MNRKANRLIDESSPYLKQHAYNPVNWYPWGEEALNAALKENKLIFVSIGYSACHWCHVMERESFSNESIAKLLNDNYICIKIDREERPDLDQTYMSAVQLMSGGGGWPLSCFTTPEGKPFYGGTYFNPDQFTQVAEELNRIWVNEPDRITTHAEGLCEGIKNSELVKEKIYDEELPDPAAIYRKMKVEFDTEYGGFNRVPKFPMPSVYQFLLRFYYHTGDKSALNHATNTLDKMINGGIYDQVGGGISRYSTDKFWLVPHFEKMLYDNAQFISLLSDTYMVTKNNVYREKIHHVLDFIERELSNGKGGYYSALDADSEGEEGKYYVWKEKEIKEIAGNDWEILKKYYGVNKEGNWEHGKNILAPVMSLDELSSETGFSRIELERNVNFLKEKLFAHRQMRVRPGLDDKILTAWNALMIKSLAEAYQSTGEDIFKEKALRSGYFLLENMIAEDFSLFRSADRKITGFLDDYAFTCKAFILLYQISFDEKWLQYLKKLIDRVYNNYFDEETGMFFYSPDNEANPVTRQLELTDNVIPSSNSAIAKVLFYASIYFDNPDYLETARQMLLNIHPHLSKSSSFFSNWLTLLLLLKYEFCEIVIVGDRCMDLRKEFCNNFLPDALFAGAKNKSDLNIFQGRFMENKSKIYVCQNRTCKMPVDSSAEALNQLKKEG